MTGSRGTLNPDQVKWAAKADEILSKPADRISSDDARVLHSREVSTLSIPTALGHDILREVKKTKAFDRLPATGTVTSHVQSVAEKNER